MGLLGTCRPLGGAANVVAAGCCHGITSTTTLGQGGSAWTRDTASCCHVSSLLYPGVQPELSPFPALLTAPGIADGQHRLCRFSVCSGKAEEPEAVPGPCRTSILPGWSLVVALVESCG